MPQYTYPQGKENLHKNRTYDILAMYESCQNRAFIFNNLIKINMLDLKTFKSALEQLEEERKIPKEKILDAIEQAMAAAYKKDYGKKGQIIRSKFDLETGKTEFFQIKIVVDESIAIIDAEDAHKTKKGEKTKEHKEHLEYSIKTEGDERVHFNPEHHILLEDAKKIKKGVELNDEIVFPLEAKDDYGRIAAQSITSSADECAISNIV